MTINKITLLAVSVAAMGGISTVQGAAFANSLTGLSAGTLYNFASPSFAPNTAVTTQFNGLNLSPNLYYDGNGGYR